MKNPFEIQKTHLDYLAGYCDIFARSAHKRYGFQMFGLFENRSIVTKHGLITSRGLVHAFVTIEMKTKDEWIVFDAKGVRNLKEVLAEYGAGSDMWIDPVTPTELIQLAYKKYNRVYDNLLLRTTKHYIRNKFPRNLKM